MKTQPLSFEGKFPLPLFSLSFQLPWENPLYWALLLLFWKQTETDTKCIGKSGLVSTHNELEERFHFKVSKHSFQTCVCPSSEVNTLSLICDCSDFQNFN